MPKKPWLPKLELPKKKVRPDITKFKSICGNDGSKVEEYRQIPAERTRGDARGVRTTLADYTPKMTDAVKIVCVNFHIFRDAAGQGHYQESEKSRLEEIMGWVNQRYEYPDSPSDVPSPSALLIKDTRIRWKLNRVEYYDDDVLHNANGYTYVAALQAAALARNPSTLSQLNVYFTAGIWDSISGFAEPPSTSANHDSWVVMLHSYNPATDSDSSPGDYARSNTLSHEFGHTLSLAHTYLSPAASADCTPGPEFLSDVFGTAPSTCPHVGDWAAEAQGAPPTITNNLMGGNKANHWISGLQAARMHRALETMSVKRYLATGCKDCISCLAFTVTGAGHVSQDGATKLIYQKVELNEAWGWNGEDFVAPFSGIYHFDVMFVKDGYYYDGTQDDVFVDVMKNATVRIARAWSGEGSGKRGTGCAAFNTKLAAGDVISTMANSDGGPKRHIALYTFSGHLICACC